METKDCKGRILMLEYYLLNHSDKYIEYSLMRRMNGG